MADGTVTFAEGLGTKALDSNELRRKQKSLVEAVTPLHGSSSQLGNPNGSSPLEAGTPQMSNSPSRSSEQCRQTSVKVQTLPIFDICSGALTPQDPSTIPSSSTGFGADSPNPTKNPSPSRKIQQALLEECLLLEAEVRARQQQQHAVTDSEVQLSNPNPKLLVNARGNLYVEGDPNLGYSVEDSKPHYAPSTQVIGRPALQPKTRYRPPQSTKDWASLFRSQGPSTNMKLGYFPELKKGKSAVVELDVTHLDDNCWSHCLVGHFLEQKMDYRLANSTAHKLWGKTTSYGLLSVKSDNAGFLYFEFKDEASQLAVLEGGPWFFSQKFIVLEKWRRMMTPTKISPSSIPTWVKLHNLPPECWTEEGLSRVASAIGQPKHVDRATEKRTRLAYARMCVEIDAADELTEEIQVKVEGDSVTVRVEYQVMPPVCTVCKVFGHATSRCPRSIPLTQTVVQGVPKEEWRPVTKGNSGRSIRGSEALDTVTGPVVNVVVPSVAVVAEEVLIESESEGEELNVIHDIPIEVKMEASPLSNTVEVDSESIPIESDPVGSEISPSHTVRIVKPVPPGDKAEAGKSGFQRPMQSKPHNNKGSGKNSGGKRWSSSSKKRHK